MKNLDTSIIIPAYNEEAIIADTLAKTASFIKDHKELLGECEVIVVAAGDGGTAALAQACASLFDNLKVVTPKGSVGKGRDVRAGFLAASGDVQFFMDADLPTPLHHIVPMVEELRKGADVVIGVRKLHTIHKGLFRSALSVVANLLTRIAILPRIKDTQCGFKGFRKEAAARIFPNITVMRWGFDTELLVLAREARLKVGQIPINDWHETRFEDLRGEGVASAARKTLLELLGVCRAAWWRWCVRHVGWAPFVAAFGVLGLAFLVGPSRSIWFDEAYSIFLIKMPVHSLIHYTSVDVHPPLYYLLLKGWAALFGDSELGLRSLSMVCGALASGVAVALARYMFGVRVALLAMPFVVVSPFLVRYDIEARMYALASLICILATYVLVRALDAKSRRHKLLLWTAYALLVAAGMYTQYYTALLWIVHAVWCVIVTARRRGIREFLLQPWLFAFAGAIALFAPWIHVLIWQIGNVQGGFWIGPVTIREVISVGTVFLSYRPLWQLNPLQSIATMAGIGLAVWLVSSAWRAVPAERRRYYTLLVLSTLLPVGLLYVLSLPPLSPVFLDRYFSHTLLAGYLLIGVAVALQRTRRRVLLGGTGMLVVLALGVGALSQQGNYNFNTHSQPQSKEVAAYVKEHAADGQTVVVDSPGQYMEMNYYLPASHVMFYRTTLTSNNGGYAPLRNSPDRLASASQLTDETVWYIYSSQKQPKLALPNYKLLRTATVADTKISTYSRVH